MTHNTRRYTVVMLVGVLLALMVALVGGAGAQAAAPQTMAAGDVFPIGSAEGHKNSPVAAMDAAGNLIVAWTGSDGMLAQRLSPTGAAIGAPFLLMDPTGETVGLNNIAANDAGNFVIVGTHYPMWEGFGRCFTADGAPRGPEFVLDGTGRLEQELAVEMAPDGSFVVVWSQQYYDGEFDYQIRARRFSAACEPLGDSFTVNDVDTGEEYSPDIAMDANGNFIVVWMGIDDYWSGVFARRFDADAAPRGGQFRVNQRQQFSQYGPSVGMDADGNAVIAFASEVEKIGAEFNYDVLARRYDAAGMPLGDVFNPPGPSPDVQYLPQVAVAPAGRFAVMWTTSNPNYDRDLWVRTYEPSGDPIGPARPVFVGAGDQSLGALAAGSGDTFLAAWSTDIVGGTQLSGRLMTFGEAVVPQVLIPTNDAHVLQARPKAVFGSRSVLQVKDAAADVNTYLKFNVSGLSGTVESATLRLRVRDGGPDGGTLYAVSPFYRDTTTLWLETGLTWNNAPLIAGAPLDETGPVAAGQWVELDVTGAVRAALTDNGRVSLVITNDARNLVSYSSKESAQPPELIVITN